MILKDSRSITPYRLFSLFPVLLKERDKKESAICNNLNAHKIAIIRMEFRHWSIFCLLDDSSVRDPKMGWRCVCKRPDCFYFRLGAQREEGRSTWTS